MLLALSGGAIAGIIFGVLGVLAIIIIASGLRIVRQASAMVVERVGKYNRTLHTGLHLLIPFFERTPVSVSLKERVADFDPQSVITKDNVTMKIDTVVYFQITDPKLYAYGVEKPLSAIENLTATTLRNIVGDMELDETLTSRDKVNTKMRLILDEATDPWGVKVNRVELKNILPPKDIQEAMEKQMRAERERRESILRAEGEKMSKILVAEGERESEVLRAKAEKEAKTLRAEGEKSKLIAEAEGQAKAIKLIIEAAPSKEYLTLQAYEAMKVVADGKATKLIIPSDIQNLAGLVASLAEVAKVDKEDPKKK